MASKWVLAPRDRISGNCFDSEALTGAARKSQTLSCKSGPFVLDAAIDWASYCNDLHRMLVGDAATTCNLKLIGGKSDMCPAQTGYGSAIDVRILMQALQIGIEFCYKTQQLTRTPERGIDPVFGAEGKQQLKLHWGLLFKRYWIRQSVGILDGGSLGPLDR